MRKILKFAFSWFLLVLLWESLIRAGFANIPPNLKFNLSNSEKAGQLIWIGLPGRELNPKIEQRLEEIKPGGIVLFSRNTPNAHSTRHFVNQINAWFLKKRLPLPFIAIDLVR